MITDWEDEIQKMHEEDKRSCLLDKIFLVVFTVAFVVAVYMWWTP